MSLPHTLLYDHDSVASLTAHIAALLPQPGADGDADEEADAWSSGGLQPRHPPRRLLRRATTLTTAARAVQLPGGMPGWPLSTEQRLFVAR